MIYKFKSWIQLDKCDKTFFPFIQKPNLIEKYIPFMDNENIELLSANPAAIPYLTLKENQNKIYWFMFVRNPDAMEYIKKYKHIVDFDWNEVIEILNNPNPEAFTIIESQFDKMNENGGMKQIRYRSFVDEDNGEMNSVRYFYEIDDEEDSEMDDEEDSEMDDEEYSEIYNVYDDVPVFWNWISSNPAAVPLLKKYPNCIDWRTFSSNKNSIAVKMLEENLGKINWSNLSANPNAIDILLQHPEKIDWRTFSCNRNPIAVKMLEENPDKIDWGNLTRNSSAIHLLEANPDKVSWATILLNKNIYEYDYDIMKKNMDVLREEMMMAVWKPSRVIKWLEAGCEDILA